MIVASLPTTEPVQKGSQLHSDLATLGNYVNVAVATGASDRMIFDVCVAAIVDTRMRLLRAAK